MYYYVYYYINKHIWKLSLLVELFSFLIVVPQRPTLSKILFFHLADERVLVHPFLFAFTAVTSVFGSCFLVTSWRF